MRSLILIVLVAAVVVLGARDFAGDTPAYANMRSAASDSLAALRMETVGKAEAKARLLKAKAEDAGWDIASGCAYEAHTVNQAILDTSITAAIKMKMASDDRVPATQVHVRTSDGVVTLTGTLARQDEAERAEALAWNAKGVTGVVSEIRTLEAPAAIDGGTRL